MTELAWPLDGYPDDVVLAAGRDRLWIAASTATLAREEVWLGEVTPGGVVGVVRVGDDAPCCRPAVAALEDGALALACGRGRIVAAGSTGAAWSCAVPGQPVHLAAIARGAHVWIAAELARDAERFVVMLAVEPATGAVVEQHQLGGGARWCRWPVLAIDHAGLVLAWCDGPARAPGVVKLARWSGTGVASEVALGSGEAPALAMLPDGAVAVAWHHGGASEAADHRDASVVRSIDIALVRIDAGSAVETHPPPGAGGNLPRGEDQGWELPAIAGDATGALLVVGRSTHGHHVARRAGDGAWSAPLALDAGGWGGRGRRHALATYRGEAWLARRAPAGIAIGVCPEPAGGGAARVSAIVPARAAGARAHGILFGDLHQHTAHSDGCGSPEELWIAARDQRGLDFAAITDHDQFCRRALGPATWQIMTDVARGFDQPGRFVALVGYEFTGPRHPGPGHKCVYFGERVPDRVPDRDVESVFAAVRELGAIAVPHHVGWTGADLAHHDPALQPVWEICSVHGCYEADGACPAHPPRADHIIPGQFVRDALDAGLRFGFIGSTDSHGLDWHHGIARWRNPFRSGLACVVDAEPTRAGILAALRARRSYATTGAKIAVRAELDGAPIGSELPEGGELVVEVTGTAPIRRIVVVERGGERALALTASGLHAYARVRLAPRDGVSYAYVRVEQADDEAAWLSPFWIGAP